MHIRALHVLREKGQSSAPNMKENREKLPKKWKVSKIFTKKNKSLRHIFNTCLGEDADADHSEGGSYASSSQIQ